MNEHIVGFHKTDNRDPVSMLAGIPVAASRLERLKQQRDDDGAIGRRIEFEKIDLQGEISSLQNRIHELTLSFGMGGHGLSDDHQQVKAVVRERDQLRDRLKRLNEHGRTTSPGRQTSGQLYGNCERYVLDTRNLSPASEPKTSLKRGEAIVEAIERHRQRLSELTAERERVRSAKLPSAIAKEKMREQISALVERGRPDVRSLVATGGDIGWATASKIALISNISEEANRGACAGWNEVDALGLLAWVHRDVLIKRLDEEISSVADDGAALTAEDKATKIDALDAETLAVERAECSLIWQGTEGGAPLSFREQSDPRAVLGLA